MHKVFTPLALASLTLAAIDTSPTLSKCNADNCARAVSGTQRGGDHLQTASSDCSNAFILTDFPFGATITSWMTWVEATSTVTVQEKKRQIDFDPVPPYASPCDYFGYSSACSCLGITPTVVTDLSSTTETIYWWDFTVTTTTVTITGKPTTTSTSSSTTTSSSSTIPPKPTCTANLLTDPHNCGSCGTVCPSGICEHGSCTSTQCPPKACGDITNCGSNASCFCFSSVASPTTNLSTGFCGANGVCSSLTPCAQDEHCNPGYICAVKTCCPEPSDELPGVCLLGTCGNPVARLREMARAVGGKGRGVSVSGRGGVRGLTAAY